MEDSASQSSSLYSQPAQLRDEATGSDHGQLEFLGDELIESPSDDYVLKDPSNASEIPTETEEENDEQAVEAPTPVKEAPRSRPNKYHGPASTWRDRTALERSIAASLDQKRAEDLSLHLYNFYSLKKGALNFNAQQGNRLDEGVRTPSRGRVWVSSKDWTSWPMAPELVPRDQGANQLETMTALGLSARKKKLSSFDILQELLIAQACKSAKEKFCKRDWEDTEFDSPAPPNDRRFPRKARNIDYVDDSSNDGALQPVVLADDQIAKSILQPSLSHMIGKLDALLMGLHHARASYAKHTKPFIGPQGTMDDESPVDKKRKRQVSNKDNYKRRNTRQKVSPDLSENLSATEDEPNLTRGRRSGSDRRSVQPPSRSRSRPDRITGLRDWSDVLGVASLCGWEGKAVAKAAERCSNLFGEGLVLRTLEEGQDGYQDIRYLPNQLPMKNSTESGLPAVSTDTHRNDFLQEIPKHKSWTRKRRAPRKR